MMQVDSPMALIVALSVVTLLGIVMGYCLGLLRRQWPVRRTIEQARRALLRQQKAMTVELTSARTAIDDQRQALARERAELQKKTRRESALELHSQLQAQRIQTLESQLRAFEDQQIRLARDFAQYKSNSSHEMALLRDRLAERAATAELPVLQKRIIDTSNRRTGPAHAARQGSAEGRDVLMAAGARLSYGMSSPLSRELEIPALAESELPDSVEDLRFELSETGGVRGREHG